MIRCMILPTSYGGREYPSAADQQKSWTAVPLHTRGNLAKCYNNYTSSKRLSWQPFSRWINSKVWPVYGELQTRSLNRSSSDLILTALNSLVCGQEMLKNWSWRLSGQIYTEFGWKKNGRRDARSETNKYCQKFGLAKTAMSTVKQLQESQSKWLCTTEFKHTGMVTEHQRSSWFLVRIFVGSLVGYHFDI